MLFLCIFACEKNILIGVTVQVIAFFVNRMFCIRISMRILSKLAVCTFFICIQKKNSDMNRQKAEEKGIGRRQRNGQVKEIGRARQGKATGEARE